MDDSDQLFLRVTGDLLKLDYRVCFEAGGRSMHPTIHDGDRITVQAVAPSEIKTGDVVLCRSRRGLIAHRVVRVQAAGVEPSAGSRGVNADGDLSFVLRGDAALACDEPVEPGQVLGRVVSVQRHGRSVDPSSRRARIWCGVRRRAVGLKRALL